jgi:flagellar motor switch protein FliG
LGTIDNETIDTVIKEFYELMLNETGARGGMGYLKEVLALTLGPSRAMAILTRLSELQPFTYLKEFPGNQLASILAKENPQTIAVVLSHLSPVQSAAVLSQLSNEAKIEVSMRIANAKYFEAEAVQDVNKALEKMVVSRKLEATGSFSLEQTGTKSLAEMLNRSDHETQKLIFENLQKYNAAVSDEVRKQMFLFEDIAGLEDKSVQRILREVDSKDLTLALKLADDKLKEKVFNNMSERAREILKEEMGYLGPVRIRQVEDAQQKILETLRRLQFVGEVVIPMRGVEEKFV